ncbi:MAG TPA: helix-turn-helix transcriptional regulator [Gemmatimonadales bacterium]|nr:helix-turn-helix transcriptional regulator [Gemmatimonadales bacterium]
MTLFDYLKAELRARDWSMTDLARRAGCSKQIVSQWLAEDEVERIIPGPKSCLKIADALGLDPDYVLELAGHRKPREQAAAPNPRLAAFISWVETAFHAMTAQEWDVREPAGRALFSVPPTDASTHRTRDARAARRPVNNRSNPDDPTLDDTLQSHLKGLHPLKAVLAMSS